MPHTGGERGGLSPHRPTPKGPHATSPPKPSSGARRSPAHPCQPQPPGTGRLGIGARLTAPFRPVKRRQAVGPDLPRRAVNCPGYGTPLVPPRALREDAPQGNSRPQPPHTRYLHTPPAGRALQRRCLGLLPWVRGGATEPATRAHKRGGKGEERGRGRGRGKGRGAALVGDHREEVVDLEGSRRRARGTRWRRARTASAPARGGERAPLPWEKSKTCRGQEESTTSRAMPARMLTRRCCWRVA